MYNVYNDMDFQVLQNHRREVMTDSMALKKQTISTMRKDSPGTPTMLKENREEVQGKRGKAGEAGRKNKRSEEDVQEKQGGKAGEVRKKSKGSEKFKG
jgi:hypothetical protein